MIQVSRPSERRPLLPFVLLILAAMAVLAAGTAGAAEILGRVVGISDGDTLTVLTPERRQVRIRLAEIDTPERAQAYGSRAQQELSGLAFGKDVRVTVTDTDRYGRTVGRVHAATVDVNAEMVLRGAAWVYRQYGRDPALLRLEGEARAARRGLWALPDAERTPPWEWRAGGRAGQPGSTPGPAVSIPPSAAPAPMASSRAPGTSFGCEGKRYCREMTSCAEARFYLTQCRVTRLDGDRDGVPCESICR